MKRVAIFGAGIAGLSAAHEFSRLGYEVAVHEINAEAGGFFRSARMPGDHGMPSEYSWHGFGPWYHNAFDVMRQIPFHAEGSVYDRGLSRPIHYGIVGDVAGTTTDDDVLFGAPRNFRLTWLDTARWATLLFKTWCANRRSEEVYSSKNASEQWRPIMGERGWKTWRAVFGPWVGSDWTRVSLHHVGQFFRRNVLSGSPHLHPADEDGPAWEQGSGSGWLLLRGPSNEVWFDRWVSHLTQSGVQFVFGSSLDRLDYDGRAITAATLASGERIEADLYVVAVNPFAAADIFDRTPELAKLEQLRLFRPLVADGPHTQVSFRIAFSERILWPRERVALLLPDSEFNLTLFAEEQVWPSTTDLGEGVASLWTATACVATVPGRVHGKTMAACTKEQFLDEVREQLLRCGELDALLREANGGRGMRDFPILRVEVWHEWQFSADGIKPVQPKWVMSANTQPYLPTQATPVSNLLLAGAHTKTEADIWSIEAAVESGRRAARAVEPSVVVLPQFKPFWLRAIAAVDDLCYRFGLPHVVDIVLAAVVVALVSGLFVLLF